MGNTPAEALELALEEVLEGNATKLSVCVALGPPLEVRFAVTFSNPSAMSKWFKVRLKSCREASGW